MSSNPDSPLSVAIEGDELVIRIGIKMLAFAAERCPLFYEYEKDVAGEYLNGKYASVTDQLQLAKDVVGELLSEDEDGTKPITSLLDEAIQKAFENGSLGFNREDE